MKTILIFVLAMAGVCGAAHAQIDMSEEVTTAAFGKPLSTKASMGVPIVKIVTYRNDKYSIIAGFKDDKAIYFIYRKNVGSSWNDDEIKSVLDGHNGGNDRWNWSKNLITGHHGPAIHHGQTQHINAAEHWHIFAHDEYAAEYYPEKTLLVIWYAKAGMDAASILQQNMF